MHGRYASYCNAFLFFYILSYLYIIFIYCIRTLCEIRQVVTLNDMKFIARP